MSSRYFSDGGDRFFTDEEIVRADEAVHEVAISLAKTTSGLTDLLMKKYQLTASQVGIVMAYAMLHNAPMILARATGIGLQGGLALSRKFKAAKVRFFESL